MTMAPVYRVTAATLVLLATLAADARGQQLLEVDGIELLGEAQLVLSEGGTCNVLESDTRYEDKQENHGAPMDVWRLDFSVRNGSGRWLDHLIARFQIGSQWPECTNWDGPDAGSFPQNIEWADSIGTIQESGRNVVAPSQTLTETRYFIVLRGDPEPRFSNWSMDFDFATTPPPPSAGAPAAAAAGSAEQETVFWQSIMNSTNPAEFEAYLAQFPNGVFRALAEARLATLREPSDGRPGADRSPRSGSSAAGGGDAALTSPDSASVIPAHQVCTPQSDGVSCWMEVSHRPGCYVWNPNPQPDETVTWTAACPEGFAQGTGTLTWSHAGGQQTGNGHLQDGKTHGMWDWVTRSADGSVTEEIQVEFDQGIRIR